MKQEIENIKKDIALIKIAVTLNSAILLIICGFVLMYLVVTYG